MHLYVLARANKRRLSEWINDLLAQFFIYKPRVQQLKAIQTLKAKPFNPDETMAVQLSVREIKLLEIVFPESAKDELLSEIQPQPFGENTNFIVSMLKKVFHLEDIGPLPPPRRFRIPHYEDIEVVGIGIKKDEYDSDGREIL